MFTNAGSPPADPDGATFSKGNDSDNTGTKKINEKVSFIETDHPGVEGLMTALQMAGKPRLEGAFDKASAKPTCWSMFYAVTEDAAAGRTVRKYLVNEHYLNKF